MLNPTCRGAPHSPEPLSFPCMALYTSQSASSSPKPSSLLLSEPPAGRTRLRFFVRTTACAMSLMRSLVGEVLVAHGWDNQGKEARWMHSSLQHLGAELGSRKQCLTPNRYIAADSSDPGSRQVPGGGFSCQEHMNASGSNALSKGCHACRIVPLTAVLLQCGGPC
jgi:hypothetical protein